MANRFRVVGTTNDWSDTTGWSLSSGGAGGQTVPSASDAVILDANSGSNLTVNASARVAQTFTVNGFTGTFQQDQQLSVSGSITLTTTAFTWTGTASNKLRMIAAGTWTTNGKTIPHDIEIGGTTTFTCTLADALTGSGTLLLSNTTSTIFSGAFAITISGACTVSGSQTVTIVASVTIGGSTTIADANVINGLFSWSTAGLTTTGNLTGTTDIILTGGTWTGAAGSIANDLAFAGNVTLSGTLLKAGAGSIAYTSGTITQGTSVLSIAASCTITTAGMSWFSIILTAAITLTINSLLTCTGTFTGPNAAITLAGTAGFTVANLTTTSLTASRTYTFTAGNTYTVTDSFVVVGNTPAIVLSMVSSSGTLTYAFVLRVGATQDVGFVTATRVDSSGGQQIVNYRGTLTTATNWTTQIPPIRPQYRPAMAL